MTNFWASAGASLVGTFAGFVLAFASSRWLSTRERKQRRTLALQAVADRLFQARALLKLDPSATTVFGADEETDRERCVRSVLQTRDVLEQVMGELRAGDPAQIPLTAMHAACLRYLTEETTDPADYMQALASLRENLERLLHELGQLESNLVVRQLGSAQHLATSWKRDAER